MDDNARLKSIINNDSSNSSLPPSADQKSGKPANTYRERTKSGRKTGVQKGHKCTTLTKGDIEEKLHKGTWRHEICTIGDPTRDQYVTKYMVDLAKTSKITENHIYVDKGGQLRVPAFLNAASGDELELSTGSIYGFCRKLSETALKSIRHPEGHLLNQNLMAADTTVVSANGK